MTNSPFLLPQKLEALRSIDRTIGQLLEFRDKTLIDIAEEMDIGIYDDNLDLLPNWQELVEGAVQLLQYENTKEVTK